MVYNPGKKGAETRSFFDLYILCSKFDDLVNVSKGDVDKLLQPRVKRKFEELIEDIKKIKYISKTETKSVVSSYFDLPSAALGNIVDQMSKFEPKFYSAEYRNPWKLEDRKEYKLIGELNEVYLALASIHGKLIKLCRCIQVNCQICLVENFDWENNWKDFVNKYEVKDLIKDEGNNAKTPEVD